MWGLWSAYIQLAELLEKPQSFVSKYERGERRLDIVEFVEVCHQLGADPHDIIKELERFSSQGR